MPYGVTVCRASGRLGRSGGLRSARPNVRKAARYVYDSKKRRLKTLLRLRLPRGAEMRFSVKLLRFMVTPLLHVRAVLIGVRDAPAHERRKALHWLWLHLLLNALTELHPPLVDGTQARAH